MEDLTVRRATAGDIDWIVDLSCRVQAALTAAGSLQRIGPLPPAMVEAAVQAGHAYLLQTPASRLGSVLVDPAAAYAALPLVALGLHTLPAPHWYLHALMLEPSAQGKGLGKRFPLLVFT
ncbi:MAG: hypothetical protein HY332_07660 [Chloroflexi bacterium]|nr:hypothetical protein [Chloroflexota bacterium]